MSTDRVKSPRRSKSSRSPESSYLNTVLLTVFATIVLTLAANFLYHDFQDMTEKNEVKAEALYHEMKAKIVEDNEEFETIRERQMRETKNTTVLIPGTKLHFETYFVSKKHAIVTMAGSSWVQPYWLGAVALVQSLREVHTRVPNILVMVRSSQTDGFPPQARKTLESLGAQLIMIDDIDLGPHIEVPSVWRQAFTKLKVWTLIEYEKILFLDSDTLIVNNIDHLLHYEELSAPFTPLQCVCSRFEHGSPEFTISSGFFILKPNVEKYDHMMELLKHTSPDPADKEQFDGVWHWGDQEMLRVVFQQEENKWNVLDGTLFDTPIGLCDCETFGRQSHSYHFTCSYPVPKPFSDVFHTIFKAKPCLKSLYYLWFKLLSKGLSKSLGSSSLFNHIVTPSFENKGSAARVLGF